MTNVLLWIKGSCYFQTSVLHKDDFGGSVPAAAMGRDAWVKFYVPEINKNIFLSESAPSIPPSPSVGQASPCRYPSAHKCLRVGTLRVPVLFPSPSSASTSHPSPHRAAPPQMAINALIDPLRVPLVLGKQQWGNRLVETL